MARPFPLRRAASGAAAGLLAGVALHVVLLAAGALGPIAAATPLGRPDVVAGAQMLSSVVLGLAFAALPVTGGWPRGLAWGLGYGAAVWFLLDFIVVRVLAGVQPSLTAGALAGLGGRLVWGAAMGLTFVALMVATFRDRAAGPIAG